MYSRKVFKRVSLRKMEDIISLEGCLISSVMGTFNLVSEEWVWFQEEIKYTTFTRKLYFRGMLK